METLTKEASQKLRQMISGVTPNATSSQESAGGQSPCVSQDGQMTAPYGQEAAPASHSQPLESRRVKMMKGTYGQFGTASSASVTLQQSLESRLAQLLDTDGSVECTLTWKHKVTPSGLRYCQLAASTRPIKETDSGLWQSPRARGDAGGNRWETGDARNLEDQAKIALWGTPRANDAEKRGNVSDDPRNGLVGQALWATPNTMDQLPPRSAEAMQHQFETARPGRTAPANLREQVHPELYPSNLWNTPKATDADKGIRTPEGAAKEIARNKGADLPSQAIANWPTPNASDNRDRGKWENPCIQRRVEKGKQINLSMLAQSAEGTEASGLTTNGSSAETEKPVGSPRLNPAFSLWLMGYSTAHHSSMLLAMQSFPKSRRNSSKRVCKEKK